MSQSLRAREIVSPHVGGLQYCAKVAADMPDEKDILSKFDLDNRPTILAWQDVQLAAGDKVRYRGTWRGGRRGIYKLARQVFYHCDIPSLFSGCGELSAHITKIAAIAAENKKVRGGDPVAAHRGSDNMESVTHAL